MFFCFCRSYFSGSLLPHRSHCTTTIYSRSKQQNIQKWPRSRWFSKLKYSEAAKIIYGTEGIRGFYRGLGALVLNYLPSSAIWWTTYEFWKNELSRRLSTKSFEIDQTKGKEIIQCDIQDHDSETLVVVDQHIGAQMGAGFLAGCFMVIFTNPLDVVKTRLQTQHALVTFVCHSTLGWSTWRITVQKHIRGN